MPSAAPAHREDPEAAQESSPLLPPTSDMANDDLPRAESAVKLISRNSFGGAAALLAQVGVVVSTAVLWRVLWTHPAGLFTYHPSFQSLAFLGFLEGILLLQPQPPNAASKRKGLQLHQIFQYTSLVLILVGASFIIYNKAIHGAKHFTTWHATFGLITLSLILLQITFGALIVYTPLTHLLFHSEQRAKQLWKYHRLSGYLTLSFLTATPLLALASDWVRMNTDAWERWVIGSGLVAAGVGAAARIQTSKLGLKSR